MRAGAFAGGLVVGAVVTAAVFVALDDGSAASARAAREAGPRAVDTATADALREEIRTLRARLDAPPAVDETPPASAPPPAPPPKDDAQAVRVAAVARVREQLASVRDAAPGSAPLLALVAEWRAHAEGADPLEAELAGRALLRLAHWGKLRPGEVDALAEDFARLAPGAPGRPGLAATVARAWADDPRLARWFDGLPPVEEPAIRAAVVEALDESPSDPYREYLVKVSRDEPHADVLAEAWMEDPVTVALTQDLAPRLIAAIEPRATRGDLPAPIRGRALFAIGLAGQYDPAGARAALGRMVDGEPDPGVRAFGRAVLEAVDRGEANVQVIDGLWSRHRRAFGE